MEEVLQKSLQLDLNAFQIDLAKVTREIKEAGVEKDRKSAELKALQLRVDSEHGHLLQILAEAERSRKAGEDIKATLNKEIADLKETQGRDAIAFERNRGENAQVLATLMSRISDAREEIESWVRRIEDTSYTFRLLSKNLDDTRAEIAGLSNLIAGKQKELEEIQTKLIATLAECNKTHAERLALENEMPAILKMREDNLATEKDLNERERLCRLMERRLKPEYLKTFGKYANLKDK